MNQLDRFPSSGARLILAVAVASLMAACNPQEPENEPATQPAAPVETAPAADVPSVGQAGNAPIELDDAKRTIALSPSQGCSLDLLNGQPFAERVTEVSTSTPTTITGWVVDQTAMTRPTPAFLRIDNSDGSRAWEIAVGAPMSRPDVAKHFSTPALTDAGFEVTVDLGSLTPGHYRLALVHERGTERFACVRNLLKVGG